jgi:predicted nuclease of predicted toxin-antitoxin system
VKLLLDAHIAKATIGALRKTCPQMEVEHLAQWRDGRLLAAEDEEILAACQDEHRVLLTYDLATIPDLLRRWMAEDRPHAGVIFADQNTVKPNDAGAVASALALMRDEMEGVNTTNLVRFLRSAG